MLTFFPSFCLEAADADRRHTSSAPPPSSGRNGFGKRLMGVLTAMLVLMLGSVSSVLSQTVSNIAFDNSSIVGGNTSQITVTLSQAAPAGGATVTLTATQSNGTDVMALPNPRTFAIAAGSTSGTYGWDTAIVVSTKTTTVTASYNNSSKSAVLTVEPCSLAGLYSLTLNPTDTAGNTTVTGTVTLTGPAIYGGQNFRLSSSDTTVATVPASVTVPFGQTSTTFTLTTLPVTAVNTVTIRAYQEDTVRAAILTVRPWVKDLKLNNVSGDISVSGGQTVQGTVVLSGTTPGALILNLSSSNTTAATVPATVTVPAGSSQANFTITANPLSAAQSAVIKVANGDINTSTDSKTRTLTVGPAILTKLSLTSARVTSCTVVGGTTVVGWVTLSGTVPVATTVALTSDNAAAPVPSSVIVPANQSEVSFNIVTPTVTASAAADLMATYAGVTKAAVLTVDPSFGVGSNGLVLSPNPVSGGSNSGGVLTLNGTPASFGYPNGLTITISSANPSVATPIQTSITIGANSQSGSFNITTFSVAAQTDVVFTTTWATGSRSATLTVLPPVLGGLSVSPSSVTGGSSTSVNGTVSISGKAPVGGLTVSLLSSVPAAASVPSTVVIPAGASSVGFAVTHYIVSAATNVIISASYNGTTKTASLTVMPPQIKTLTIDPNPVIGGNPATGTITLDVNAPSPNGTTITLTSSNTAKAFFPNGATITVPAGLTTQTFAINTKPLRIADVVTITALCNGTPKAALLTVGATCLYSLSLNPSSIQGGTPVQGILILNGPAPDAGEEIALTSSNPSLVQVPDIVTIPGGQTTGTFVVETQDVASLQTVSISAALICVTKTATLTLLPPPPTCTASPLLSVTLNPTSVYGGAASQGTVTLSAPAITGGQFVQLASDNAAAVVDPTVFVAAGQTTATFTVTTHAVPTTTTATITASYAGVFLSAPLTINTGMSPQSLSSSGGAPLSNPAFAQQRHVLPPGAGPLIPISSSGPGFADPRQPASSDQISGAIRRALQARTTSAEALGGDGGQDLLEPGQCGPMDVVFVVDDTGSMGGAIQNIQTGLKTILGDIITASNNDYRMALVTFKDNVTVRQTLASQNYAQITTLINQLAASGGNGEPEASDQALNTVVNNLSASQRAAGQQVGDFNTPFRGNARKIVILVTDAYPAGFNDSYDPVDAANLRLVSQEAAAKGIQISVIEVAWIGGIGGAYIPEDLADLWINVAQTSGGDYDIALPDGSGTDVAIDNTIFRCGGYGSSQIIYTRDDRTLPHDPISIVSPTLLGSSPQPATFDLSGVATGTVTGGYVSRQGLYQRVLGAGAGFDLQWGVQSVTNATLTSWGDVAVGAQGFPDSYLYSRDWFLPERPSDLTAACIQKEIEQARGLWYQLSLVDRISSVCGTFTIADTPQANAPLARNTLTFLVSPTKTIQIPGGSGGAGPPGTTPVIEVITVPCNPRISQGSVLDITIPGKELPTFGSWEIRLNGTVIASSGAPNGWYVEFDHTVYRGVWVVAPASASISDGYQVRFSDVDDSGQPVQGSGAFEVVGPRDDTGGAGASITALTFNPNPVFSGNNTIGTVQLSAPAPAGGAAVALVSRHPSYIQVPPSVVVPVGQITATFTAATRYLAGTDPYVSAYVSASYNGTRTTSVTILRNSSDRGQIGPPVLSATAGNSVVNLSWTPPIIGLGRGPVTYNVKRSQRPGGPYSVLFAGLKGTSYRDTDVFNGVTYYYVVSGADPYGEGPNSNEVSATPYGGTVATPLIDPNGGVLYSYGPPPPYGPGLITLSCATRGALIYYTTDGTTPTERSRLYAGPFTPDSTQTTNPFTLKVRAFKLGWLPSNVASAVFSFSGTPGLRQLYCGDGIVGVLQTTDLTSWRKGAGYFADRYLLTLVANQKAMINLRSTDFDTYLALYKGVPDANGNPPANSLVAENDNKDGTTTNSYLEYTYVNSGGPGPLPQNNAGVSSLVTPQAIFGGSQTFTIEVTSALPGALGLYTLDIACTPAGTNQPPTVQIVNPAANTTFAEGDSILIEARAADPDGTISKVQFYSDDVLLSETTIGNLYSYLWTNPAVGTHTLRAIAIDNLGAHTTSTPVTVTVRAADQATPISCGATVQGELTIDSPISTRATDGIHFRDLYTFSGTQGQQVYITLRSTDFDTRLYLVAPDGSIFSNSDESQYSTDSRIACTLPLTGTYTIEATSDPAGQEGEYTLSLLCPTGNPTPGIQVLLDGTTLASGALVDYGSTPAGVPVSKTFTIRNTGTMDLNVTGMSWSGDFSLTQRPLTLIPAGGETLFTMRFNATDAGSTTPVGGILFQIRNNAQDPFSLQLKATVAAASSVQLSGLSVTPTTVNGGQTSKGTVTLTGAAPQGGFTVTLASDQGCATVPATVLVPSGATSVDFTISTKSVTADTTATLTASATGSTNKTATLVVKQSGLAPTITLDSITNTSGGTTFTAPATAILQATAAAQEPGATITKVEFLSGTTLVGEGLQQSGTNTWKYTWKNIAAGSYTMTARATDSGGRTATSSPSTFTVSTATPLPTPTIDLVGQPAGTVTFTFSAQVEILAGTGTPANTVLYYTLDGSTPDPSSATTYRYGSAFTITYTTTVKAKAFNGTNSSAVAAQTFTRTDTLPTPLTAVAITAPVDSTKVQQTTFMITSPTVITGSFNGVGSWALSYRLTGDTTWIPLATGEVGSYGYPGTITQDLATFDPTLMLNGQYDIRLQGFKPDGTAVPPAYISLGIEGNQKVGTFTFSVVDMTVPTAGIPIQVIRTYDSRDKRVGDFGVGWTLSLSNVRYQTNGPTGSGWQVSGSGFGRTAIPAQLHYVSVTLPNGDVYAWVPYFVPTQVVSGGVFGQVEWAPATRLARRAELVPADGSSGEVYITDNLLYGLDDIGEPSSDVYNPTTFRVTLRDGTKLFVDSSGLTEIDDRNGNYTQLGVDGYGHDGIATYSPQQQLLRSVRIFRGTGNRITQIQDPKGASVYYGNGSGLLTDVTSRVGAVTHYTYDFRNNLTAIVTPTGKVPIQNAYDANGRLIGNVDAFGNSVGYAYTSYGTGTGGQVTVTDRAGKSSATTYNSYGSVTNTQQSVTRYNPDGSVAGTDSLTTTMAYGDGNNPGKPTTVTDGLGNTTHYTYNEYGDATEIRDANGRLTRYEYNAFGEISKVIGPDLKVLSESTFDPQGNPLVQKGADGSETRFSYTPGGQPQTMQDALGRVTAYAYDALGNTTGIKDALGNVTAYAYDGNGNRTGTSRRRTKADGTVETIVTQTVYDGEDRAVTTYSPTGARSDTSYNGDGQVDAVRDSVGRVTRYAYDAQGQRIATQQPDGTVSQTVYDVNGRVSQVIGTDGAKTQTFYDEAGRAVASTRYRSDGTAVGTTRTVYNVAGHVTSTTDARGQVTYYTYDANGNQLRVYNAVPSVTTTYDAYNRPITVTDGLNRVTETIYDAAGRVVEVTYPDGTSTSTSYDALGRRVTESNENGETTSYGYDELGRLISVSDPLGNTTRYGYDEVGNKVSQTDALGRTTRFSYDAAGHLIGKKLPGGQIYQWSYLPDGRLNSTNDWSDPTGSTPGYLTSYSYDGVGRLSTKLAPATSESLTYNYDSLGRQYQSFRNTTNLVQKSFDPAGRVSQISTPVGSLTYGYDSASAVNNRGYSSQSTTYSYDSAGRLSTVGTPSGTVSYIYDGAGQLTQIGRPSGASIYTYDLRGRVLKIAHANSSGTAVAWETYDYDETGRRLSYTDQSGTSVSYGYDGAGRLIQEKYAGGRLVTYGYDAVGNRKNKSDSADPLFSNTGSIYDYSYDPQNDRLLQVQRNGSVYRTYTYDNAGRVSSVNGTAVIWTFDGQVASIGGTSFSYDGEGNRIGKTTGATTTSYLVDPTWAYPQVAETDQGTTKTRMEWGIGLLKEGGSYTLSDGLDTLRALTNTSGGVTSSATYADAFGYPTNTGGQLYGLNGQVWDPETELYYLRARYYDPKAGRFISQDPYEGDLWDPPSLHRYTYVANDPVSRIDPGGKDLGDLMVSMAISSGLCAVSSAAIAGAREFFFGEGTFESVLAAEGKGFLIGAGIGALIPIPIIGGGVLMIGTAIGGWQVGTDISQGRTGEALFDAAALFGGLALGAYGDFLQQGGIGDGDIEGYFGTGLGKRGVLADDLRNAMSNNDRGAAAEALVKQYVRENGGTDVVAIQNASGNGIDLAYRTLSGKLVIGEIKSSITGRFSLSSAQQDAHAFITSRLTDAAAQQGRYVNIDQDTAAAAARLLADYTANPNAVLKYHFVVDVRTRQMSVYKWGDYPDPNGKIK